MTFQSKQAEIERIQAKSTQKTIQSLLVIVAMLFTSAFLPQFLIRYLYADQQLFEQPKLLEYMPMATFVIGIGYFLFVIVGNMLRDRRIKNLEQELLDLELSGDCGCGCGSCDDDWMKEFEEDWKDNEALSLDGASEPKTRKASKSKKTSKKSK